MHRPCVASAVLLALLTACQAPDAPAAGAPPTRAQLWTTCQDANRGLAAVEACSGLLASTEETDKTRSFLHYNRGLALSRRGRSQAAIEDFDAALKLDPFFALALYQRGIVYQNLGQSIRAEQDLQRARQLNPRLP